MPSPPPSSFLYLSRDGQHPSSLVELCIGYFVWPKDVQNSSKALVLEYFPHVPYIFHSTLLLKTCIFVFLLIIFVFQMFFKSRKCSPCLVLISASVFPSFVTLAPRYVNSVFYVLFSEFDWVCSVTVVSQCFSFVFVDMKSNFHCVSDQFLCFTLYVSVAVCKQRCHLQSLGLLVILRTSI